MSASRSSEQLPLTGNSTKPNRAERAERQVGARDQVANGSRDHDLAIAGLSKDSSRDVHADPSDVVVAELDLTGVDRRTDRQTTRHPDEHEQDPGDYQWSPARRTVNHSHPDLFYAGRQRLPDVDCRNDLPPP